MKNKLLIVLFSLTLLQASSVAEELGGIPSELPAENTEMMETIDNPDTVEKTDLLEMKNEDNVYSSNKFLKKSTGKNFIIKKFLLAMLAVIGSSVFIYFCLAIYNKAKFNLSSKITATDKENALEEPDNMLDAVKTFLDKTNWE